MNYYDYSVEDFANDQLFVQWVRKPDARLDMFWNEWLDRYPEKRPVVEQARKILLFLTFEVIHPSQEEMLEVKNGITRFIQEHSGGERDWPKEQNHPTKSVNANITKFFKPLPRRVGVAALGLLSLSLVLLFKFYQPQVLYKTSFGETKKMELPDGSRVVLNGNSSLHFSGDWNKTHNREVWLTGEGYFEVLKKPEWEQSTFTVHTGGVEVKVLGTSFNVNNRRGKVQVMLKTGKVQLFQPSGGKEAIDMQPRDFVEVQENGGKVLKKEVAPERYISWVQKNLVFEDTPIYQIAQYLEDTYGLFVVFREESLQDLRFTGAVPNQEIDLFLRVLGESMDVNISRQGQTIIMSKE